MNLPPDLSNITNKDMLDSLEMDIKEMWECKYEADKLFIIKDEALRIVRELKIRKEGK